MVDFLKTGRTARLDISRFGRDILGRPIGEVHPFPVDAGGVSLLQGDGEPVAVKVALREPYYGRAREILGSEGGKVLGVGNGPGDYLDLEPVQAAVTLERGR